MLIIQKNVVTGLSFTEKVRSASTKDNEDLPKMAGIIPISGLQNTYDADYDPISNDVCVSPHS